MNYLVNRFEKNGKKVCQCTFEVCLGLGSTECRYAFSCNMLPRVCIHDLHILVAVEHGLEAIYVQGAVSAELWRRSRQIQVQRAIFSLRLVLILQCSQTLSSIDPRLGAH